MTKRRKVLGIKKADDLIMINDIRSKFNAFLKYDNILNKLLKKDEIIDVRQIIENGEKLFDNSDDLSMVGLALYSLLMGKYDNKLDSATKYEDTLLKGKSI